MAGRVEGIYIAAEHGDSPEPVDSVRALAGRGLEGNRHFFDEAASGTALTLIAAEAVEAMERDAHCLLLGHEIGIGPGSEHHQLDDPPRLLQVGHALTLSGPLLAQSAAGGSKMGTSSDQPPSTPRKLDLEPLAEAVIGAAIRVHRALGPGLLESA